MKLSMAAEFAIRGILCLAEHYGQGPVTLQEVCRRRKLRKEYLTKIFGLLARANLVDAVRGKGGGYILSPCHNIQPDTPLENVLAVYRAVREFRGEKPEF